MVCFTYAETNPESKETLDLSDTGVISECEHLTFRELVVIMQGFPITSKMPNNYSTNVWYSTGFFITCHKTGTEREESLHYHQDNTPNAAKYWKWARKIVDSKKIKVTK